MLLVEYKMLPAFFLRKYVLVISTLSPTTKLPVTHARRTAHTLSDKNENSASVCVHEFCRDIKRSGVYDKYAACYKYIRYINRMRIYSVLHAHIRYVFAVHVLGTSWMGAICVPAQLDFLDLRLSHTDIDARPTH